jgi:hypothetical protein
MPNGANRRAHWLKHEDIELLREKEYTFNRRTRTARRELIGFSLCAVTAVSSFDELRTTLSLSMGSAVNRQNNDGRPDPPSSEASIVPMT